LWRASSNDGNPTDFILSLAIHPENDDATRAGLEAAACVTALGDEGETWAALCENRSGLRSRSITGKPDGETAPLALRGEMNAELPQRWREDLRDLAGAA